MLLQGKGGFGTGLSACVREETMKHNGVHHGKACLWLSQVHEEEAAPRTLQL